MPVPSRTSRVAPQTIGAIILRDGWSCAYCGARLTRRTVVLDHVIPRRDGGRSTPCNLVVACWGCNTAKGSGPVPPGSRREVERRLSRPVNRVSGRKLARKLYPWADRWQEACNRRGALSKAKRRAAQMAATSAGLGGTAFPFGALEAS